MTDAPAHDPAQQASPRPARTRRRVPRWVALLVGLAVGAGAATAWPIVARPPLIVGQDAITDAASASARVSIEDAGGRTLVIRPAHDDGRLLFIFYPGGLVRPQAYEWLARSLAAQGVMTVIPEFAADLAVTGINRADALIDTYAAGRPVVLGGHSLGGAMACDWASRNPSRLQGLVLAAAYPADSTSITGTNTLMLGAEHDGLATPAKMAAGLTRLPQATTTVTVSGAVHSFFGRYGPQAGDGVPTVSRADAEAQILTAVTAWFATL